MDFSLEYTKEQEEFAWEVREWLEENVPKDLINVRDTLKMSHEQWQKRREFTRKLGQKGWLYPGYPCEYGGGGLDAAIQSSLATNYGKFLEIGKVVGVPPNLVLLTTEHLWRSGDYTNPEVVWRALCEMVIPPKLAKVWFYGWCSFMGKYIPQQLRDEIENL